MNRRALLQHAAAATILAGTWRSAVASAAASTPTPTWDETSFLYGNAWDLLPKANDGEISITGLAISTFGQVWGSTPLYGLIHNNTDSAHVLINLTVEAASYVTFEVTQGVIQSGAYALFTVGLPPEYELGDEAPLLEPEFVKREDVDDSVGFFSASVPLQIDSVEFSPGKVTSSITNLSVNDYADSFLQGIILWFDETGAPFTGLQLGTLATIPAGGSSTVNAVVLDEYDAELPFLVGYKAVSE